MKQTLPTVPLDQHRRSNSNLNLDCFNKFLHLVLDCSLQLYWRVTMSYESTVLKKAREALDEISHDECGCGCGQMTESARTAQETLAKLKEAIK